MADCGAAGSALDRAASRIVGTSGSETMKAISSFVGNAANSTQTNPTLISQSGVELMPAAPPKFIQMNRFQNVQEQPTPQPPPQSLHPSVSSRRIVSVSSGNNIELNHMKQMDSIWMGGGQQQQMQPQQQRMGPYPMAARMQNPAMQMQMQMQYQMQYQMQMQMHSQQMMMQQQQQQQQNLMNANFANKKLQKQTETTTLQSKEETKLSNQERLDEAWNASSGEVQQHQLQNEHVNTTTDSNQEERAWYESVESDFQKEMDRLKSFPDDEGLVEGATIEELAKAWEDAQREFDLNEMDNIEIPSPQSIPYQFHPESSNLPPSTSADHITQGHRHFNAGQIKSAIISFEAAIQTQTQTTNTTTTTNHGINNDIETEAWHMLGKCYAENDQDVKAISCLEHAVERDPYNLDALLALGVSYVNELDNANALSNLKMWIEHNPKYAGMEMNDIYGDLNDGANEMDQVQNLLLQALQWDSNDADVKEALGVCNNVSRDYDSAVIFLKEALEIKPDNYQLWNKLGATLANSNQSDKALPAYLEALKLKPRYARAWLNMAISHSNLQNFEEAARCYLQTLSLNPGAVHCWSYLRIAMTCMERWDLLPLVAAQDLTQLNQHFEFIQY